MLPEFAERGRGMSSEPAAAALSEKEIGGLVSCLTWLVEGKSEEEIGNLAAHFARRAKDRNKSGGLRIIPPVQIAHDELNLQVDTDKPVKVVDVEPDPPGATVIGFDEV